MRKKSSTAATIYYQILRLARRKEILMFETDRLKSLKNNQNNGGSWTSLQKFQIFVGIVVSVTTVIISWQTFILSERSDENNTQLKRIEQQLAQTRFGFERIRDVYDRTEKYLASEKQNQARGRVLIVLINSLPDSQLRAELLTVVTESAKLNLIAAEAGDLAAGISSKAPKIPTDPNFSGDLSLKVDNDEFTLTTQGDFSFVDSEGMTWHVPKGTVVSGAVVPRIAWTSMGSPLTSDYAIPLVLLEHHSALREQSVEKVYKMFYESMLKAGVNDAKAKVLYTVLRMAGPRWSTQ